MTPQQPLIDLCRSALENNGGPIGHKDGYVMVTREDFDALAAAVKEYDSQSVKGAQPTTSLSDEFVQRMRKWVALMIGLDISADNVRHFFLSSGLPAENDRLRRQLDLDTITIGDLHADNARLTQRVAAAESEIADPAKIVAWWNGFSVDMEELDPGSIWSVSKRENDWHDIPLVAKSNPCNAIAAQQVSTDGVKP